MQRMDTTRLLRWFRETRSSVQLQPVFGFENIDEALAGDDDVSVYRVEVSWPSGFARTFIVVAYWSADRFDFIKEE